MGRGRLGRRADLRRDRRLAGVRLDGRGQGRAGVLLALPGPRPRPGGHPGQPGLRRARCKTLAAKAIPGFEELESMWATRAPLGWDEHGPEPDRQGGRARCCRTSSRPPPARSCTSTAASTPWVPDAPPGIGSVPRRDLTRRAAGPRRTEPLLPAGRGQADPGHQRAGIGARRAPPLGFADRIGLRNARPGEPGTGFRQRFAARAVARLVRAIAAEARHRRGSRCGCGPPTTRTSSWWPSPGGTATGPRRWVGPWPRCSTRCPAADLGRRGRARRPRRSRRPSPAPGPTTIAPADPGGGRDRHQRQDHHRRG